MVFDTDWSSQAPDYRQNLRKVLLETLKKFTPVSPEEERRLLDLDHLPEISGYEISVSHCPEAGGFSIRPGKLKIGLDVEQAGRIRENVVKRISFSDEVQRAPSPACVWCGKEAAFKALNSRLGLKTLSQVETKQWYPLQTHLWLFKAIVGGLEQGRGLSGSISGLHYALFEVST